MEAACDYAVRKTLEQDGLCVSQLWGMRTAVSKTPPSVPFTLALVAPHLAVPVASVGMRYVQL